MAGADHGIFVKLGGGGGNCKERRVGWGYNILHIYALLQCNYYSNYYSFQGNNLGKKDVLDRRFVGNGGLKEGFGWGEMVFVQVVSSSLHNPSFDMIV